MCRAATTACWRRARTRWSIWKRRCARGGTPGRRAWCWPASARTTAPPPPPSARWSRRRRSPRARSIATANGVTTVTEDWDLTGAGGEHARLHVKYVRGPANRAASDVRFVNPANPGAVRHGATPSRKPTSPATSPPRRRTGCRNSRSRRAAASSPPLFDGTQKALSWDSQPTYRRAIASRAVTSTCDG